MKIVDDGDKIQINIDIKYGYDEDESPGLPQNPEKANYKILYTKSGEDEPTPLDNIL